MASAAASSLLLSSTCLANVSSSRHRPPSLAPQRVEGWTEVWGSTGDTACKSSSNDNDDGNSKNHRFHIELPYLPPRYIHVLDDGCDYIHGKARNKSSMKDDDAVKQQHHPSSTLLQLTQYRVAWFEQLVLRICYIPYVVSNSGYAANESTGALPSLLDLSFVRDDDSSKSDNGEKSILPKKPVLIGRNQPGGLGSNFFQQCNGVGESNTTPTMTTTRRKKYHPTSFCFIHSGSHIVDYLRKKYITGNNNILFPEQLVAGSFDEEAKDGKQLIADAMAFESMIQDKLNYILLALRYGNDPAWEGVYKHQCIRATLDPTGIKYAKAVVPKKKAIVSFWAQYQAYSERWLAMHNLLPSTHAVTSLSTHGGIALDLFRYNDYRYASSSKSSDNTAHHQHHPYSSLVVCHGGVGGGDSGRVNVYRAMELADSYYAALEAKLVASSSQECCDNDNNNVNKSEEIMYLLGSDKPTYVDALLFAHLAEALCDIHLVLVLAKYSRLTRYFQRLYDHYFGDEYVEAWQNHASKQGCAENSDWIQKNNMINALNAFNQIPEPTTISKGASDESDIHDKNMVHAIQLMQQIAVHCHELDEALRDAAVLRNAEGKENSVLENCHRPVGARLYQWLMGGDVDLLGSGGSTKVSPESDDVTVEDESDDEDRGPQSSNKNEPPSTEEEDKRRRYQEIANKMKRDRRSHDEIWLSCVFMTVVAAFVISATGKSQH